MAGAIQSTPCGTFCLMAHLFDLLIVAVVGSTTSADNALSLALVLGFVALYSTTGGLRSVISTDVIQFGVMLAGTALYAFFASRSRRHRSGCAGSEVPRRPDAAHRLTRASDILAVRRLCYSHRFAR